MSYRTTAIATLSLFTLLLTSCALGPDYVRPKEEIPATFKAGSPWKEATPLDTLAKGEWWRLFGDPELNRLEEMAAAGSPQLTAAFARLEQARALYRASEAEQLPSVDLDPSFRRGRTAGVTSSLFSLPLDLAYEIDLWGRVRRSVEAASAEAEGSAALYESVRLGLHAETARIYFSLRAIDREADLLRRTVELRRDALRLVESRFRNGLVGELDVARAETELATTEAEAAALAKSRGEVENALAILVGQNPSSFSLEPAPLELAPPAVDPGLPSSLLERRPDVASAERAMAAANARIGVAKTAFFPSIRLTGSAGYASAEASDLFDWESRAWGLGPSISLPIFDGGRNRAALRRAEAAYDEAVAAYRGALLTAFAEVEDALNGLQALDGQAAALDRAVDAAHRAAEISEKRYHAGLVSYLEVVDSRRSSLQVERSAVQTLGQRMQTTVLLIKALGGGWSTTHETTP